MTNKNLMVLIDNLAAAKEASDAAKKTYDSLKCELIKELNARNVSSYTSDSHTVSITETISFRLDTKRIKLEFPEIYAEYGKKSASTRVNII